MKEGRRGKRRGGKEEAGRREEKTEKRLIIQKG